MTATPSEIRVPRSTWANWSLPTASVPNGWSHDGGTELSGVSSPGAYFHTAPPTKASSTTRRSTTRLIIAARCRRNRRRTSWNWLRWATVNSRSVADTCGGDWTAVGVSGIADPGVEDGVEQVGYQVEHDHHDRRDQQPGRGRVHVLLADGADQEVAHAVPLEDRLGDHGPADDRGQVERGDRGQRDQGGAQAVPDHHRAPGQPLGPGQPQVVAVEHLQHRGPLEAAPRGVGDQRERDGGQHHVPEHVGELRPGPLRGRYRAVADRVEHLAAGRQVELDAALLEQDRQPERRHRQEEEAEERRG